MAVTYQTNYNAYPNVTISNGGASGTISGISGATLTSTGSSYTLNTGAGVTGTNGMTYSTSWTQPSTNFINSSNKVLMSVPHGEDRIVLDKEATLEVNGTVKINGIDLDERLKTIEKLLNIPQRDAIMEAKYPRLKKIHDEYMHELEKYYTWDRVKGEEK